MVNYLIVYSINGDNPQVTLKVLTFYLIYIITLKWIKYLDEG